MFQRPSKYALIPIIPVLVAGMWWLSRASTRAPVIQSSRVAHGTGAAQPAAEQVELAPLPPRRRDVEHVEPAGPKPKKRTQRDAVQAARNAKTERKRGHDDAISALLQQAAREPDKVPFVVEPTIDANRIGDLDSFARCRYHARRPGMDAEHSGQATFTSFQSFVAGHYLDASQAPRELIVRFDHPGALPTETVLSPGDWMGNRDRYVARPLMVLEPIRSTLVVGSATKDSRRARRSGPSSAFRGTVSLLEVTPTGHLALLDEHALRSYIRRDTTVRLRIGRPQGLLLIVGRPKSERFAPDLLATKSSWGEGEHRLVTGLQSRPYEKKVVRFVDPFGEPYPGATLSGRIIEELISLRQGSEQVPATFHGFAFVETPEGVGRRFDGAFTTDGDQTQGLGMFLAPLRFEAESDGSGIVDLVAVARGLYACVARTPLDPSPYPVAPFQRREGYLDGRGRPAMTYVVDAPVGGVEVERPSGLGSKKDAWSRAEVKLTAGDQVITTRMGKSGRTRALVPPYVSIEVSVEFDGKVYTAVVSPLAPGTKAIAVPIASKTNARKPEPDSAKSKKD